MPIDPCRCGAETCQGRMLGFKNLPDDEKEKLLPYTALDVRVPHFIDKKENGEKHN
jgi:hypothetical protein